MPCNLNHVHPPSKYSLGNLAFSENSDPRIRGAWLLKFCMSDQQEEIKDSYPDQTPGNTGNKKILPIHRNISYANLSRRTSWNIPRGHLYFLGIYKGPLHGLSVLRLVLLFFQFAK